jgi:hypothetical protein
MATERVKMVCQDCGAEDVTRDAWAAWDAKTQDWVSAALLSAIANAEPSQRVMANLLKR